MKNNTVQIWDETPSGMIECIHGQWVRLEDYVKLQLVAERLKLELAIACVIGGSLMQQTVDKPKSDEEANTLSR